MASNLPLKPNESDSKATKTSKNAARMTEETRRKDISKKDVAKEALACYYELVNRPEGSRSPSEAFTVYGYGLRVIKAALKEEERIKAGLRSKPSKDVTSDLLSVSEIKTKYEIPEFKA